MRKENGDGGGVQTDREERGYRGESLRPPGAVSGEQGGPKTSKRHGKDSQTTEGGKYSDHAKRGEGHGRHAEMNNEKGRKKEVDQKRGVSKKTYKDRGRVSI